MGRGCFSFFGKYTGGGLRIQKTPGALGATLSKIDLGEIDRINNYRSFVGQLMWYKNKVGPDVSNAARELAVHMSHPGPEHWKSLGHLLDI